MATLGYTVLYFTVMLRYLYSYFKIPDLIFKKSYDSSLLICTGDSIIHYILKLKQKFRRPMIVFYMKREKGLLIRPLSSIRADSHSVTNFN